MLCLPHILALALHSQGGFNTAVPGLGALCRHGADDAWLLGRKMAEETKTRIRQALAGRAVRKTPLRDEEVEALIQRNKARRVRPERHDLRAAYAQAGAVTAKQKQSVARTVWLSKPENKVKAVAALSRMQHTEASRAKLRQANTGSGNAFYGKKHTDETREKMRQAHAARPPVACPHCGVVGRSTAMLRWHFDRCRSKS